MTSEDRPTGLRSTLDTANKLVEEGRSLDAIPLLSEATRRHDSAIAECKLASLRRKAFDEVGSASRFPEWPVDVEDLDTSDPHIPEIAPEELTGETLRRAIRSHGCLKIPGLLDAAQVEAFVDGIENALRVREERRDTPYKSEPNSWFAGLQLPKAEGQSLSRNWIAGAGGLLACDSPRVLQLLFDTYEAVGLRKVLTEYLGERPILSANKCTLRKVPLTANTDWHQDGAFIGQGIRAMNVWVALTDCGVDAPGMDLVPRRFEEIVETGTGGAIFDWAVGPDVVAELSADHPVVRPQFNAGDALLFDDLFLHRSAVSPEMTKERYALESWFFAKTGYPSGQVPLVW
ncbi:MAG: phytanoyl-CoA dioxygenase family protein [Acidimicrobiales bacterium]|nr:phytanoyl-CoA dioxygenase family protein [Acidimicrobiales bacterium]